IKEKMKKVAFVITGEGKIDAQTAYGKVPSGVAKLAKSLKIPTIAVAGQVGENRRKGSRRLS
ncbi:glycerate kinase, partial [Candidatus Parcubacteria bacterium]|nr:glycerate kinase [Candidatus Parcubacteria bacterium]